MDRGRVAIVTFLLTATSLEAFQVGFRLIMDYTPGQFWLIPLLIVIPVWPIMGVIESDSGLPLEVTDAIQTVLASVFWGLVASAAVFLALTASRQRTLSN